MDTPQTPAPETAKAPVVIPQAVRSLNNKALAAMERSQFDVAIDLFQKCVASVPGYLGARRNLRLSEIARFKIARKGALARKIAALGAIPTLTKAKGLLAVGKANEALLAAEQLLAIDPLNTEFALLFAKAACAAKLNDHAIMSLEIFREQVPGDLKVIEALGRVYFEEKNYKAARECLEKVVMTRPNDSDLLRLLKDTEALSTLDSGWEQAAKEGKDYKSILANKELQEQLERKNKAVTTEKDAEALIKEAREKIEKEPNNLNYYHNLGSLLLQHKRFEEALQVYADAQKINAQDPELDRRITAVKVAQFDQRIEALTAEGKADEAQAAAQERAQFIFDDTASRVERYPNDLRLRYEYGRLLYENDYFDEAVQQLQAAQRSPKDRVHALYYLGLCFREKGMPDMASMQLEQALELLPTMDTDKMNVLYVLAGLYQEQGRLDEAAKMYKDIYRVDVSYRDIAKKVEEIYAAQKNATQK